MAQDKGTEPKITVRPMLTTSQKNFRDVQHPPSILSPSDTTTPAITREDLNVHGSRCFRLHSLLSPEECQHYIEDTERIGYSDLLDLFPPEYRSNDRVLSICQPLVDTLWKRLNPNLTRGEVIRIRPIGFGNEGTWKPFRLNECCKFGKYKAGGHFSPHLDGPWVPHEDESSVFTVVIYLNSDFLGGETRFLNEVTKGEACVVTPRQGTALIFNHDTLHEGLPVIEGVKYIIRTEIMYRRVDREMIPNPLDYQTNENYLTTLALYQKSWELEQAGDSEGFTDTYLAALKGQRKAQRSVGSDVAHLSQQALPYEMYIKIFSYLSPGDVCVAMRVCKLWYDMAMDGQLWYDLYRQKWPIGFGLEAQLDHTKSSLATATPPFVKDWYGLFKQRVKMDSPAQVMVVDLGSFSCKCAVVDRVTSRIKTTTIESVVAVVPGVFDLHLRRGEWERYFSGKEAKTNFPNHLVNIIEKGIPVRAELLPEIITGFYYACKVPPKFTPVVILEPPGLWTPKIRSEVGYTFVKMFMQRSVSFLSSAVATLCGVEMTSGVVVDVGHGVATCCAVWEGEERPGSIAQDPLKCTAFVLAEMVNSVLASCTEEMRSVLRERVVLTGGKAPKASVLEGELRSIHFNYSVIEPSSIIYGSIGGGCMLSSLINFSTRQDCSALINMDSEPVKAMDFYQFMITTDYYWISRFNSGNDSEEDEENEAESDEDEEEKDPANQEEPGDCRETGDNVEKLEHLCNDRSTVNTEEQSGDPESVVGVQVDCGNEDKQMAERDLHEDSDEGDKSRGLDIVENAEIQDDKGEREQGSNSSDLSESDNSSESEAEDTENTCATNSGHSDPVTTLDLQMAGVTVPVIGLVVEAGETDPDSLGCYLDRVTYPYGYHDDGTFMGKCI